MMLLILQIMCIINLLGSTSCHEEKEEIPNLILISFDGFRWDYMDEMDHTDIPNLVKFRDEGVYAREGIKNAFISSTYPNHYSILTGLYADSHGILANTMYDPVFKDTYNSHDRRSAMDGKWYTLGGEPIWVTNQKQGDERRSGVCMWPNSIAPIKGRLPSRYLFPDVNVSSVVKIETMIDWFLDKEPINLGLIYYREPDHTAHSFGPDSVQTKAKIKLLDEYFGYLLHRLEETGLDEAMNIIVTSGHGMTYSPPEKLIYLNDYVDPSLYTLVNGDASVAILPKDGHLEHVYSLLRSVPNITVYKKEDIPEEYHYKHNRRTAPLLLVADLGHIIQQHKVKRVKLGNHGYNNSERDMHPFFMARGPAFKQNISVATFLNVDIYEMMCHILSISPAPNNGSLQRVLGLLETVDEHSDGNLYIIYFVVIPLCMCLSGAFCGAVCCYSRITHRHNRKFNGLIEPEFSKLATNEENILSESEEEFP